MGSLCRKQTKQQGWELMFLGEEGAEELDPTSDKEKVKNDTSRYSSSAGIIISIFLTILKLLKLLKSDGKEKKAERKVALHWGGDKHSKKKKKKLKMESDYHILNTKEKNKNAHAKTTPLRGERNHSK
eukprot:TRINITY_DN20842_c0_g1_i1.p1 TRINITY_DN20842_c0_g1~~TRINITY_DN20842_c0_g1_i1.p1  ORF type:complete len:128 (-),score=24.56 TRINITY_DN20842_c0_g1_i1:173-556(-)